MALWLSRKADSMAKDTDGLASVIIPTYERKSYLRKVLEPILCDPMTGEIIVVIDGSHDGTLEFLTEWALREERIHPIFQENSGSAVAMQAGVEVARFEIVVLLDDDVQADPGLISGHVKAHSAGDGRVVLGYMPTVLPQPRRPGQAASFLYAQSYEDTCILYESDSRNILTHLWGGNISLKRGAALAVRLCSDLPLKRQEDMGFGLRCMEAGMIGVFDRSLTSRHLHSRTVEKFANECWSGGETRAILCQAYPELLSEIRPSNVVPTGIVWVFQLLSAPVIEPFVSFVLMNLISVAGRMEKWGTETLVLRLLRQIKVFAGWRYGRRNGS
jgi:glycosyltransferase involved in cell wall biosynthesis